MKMNKLTIALTISAMLTALSATNAFASQELAKKNNCLTCHAAEKKVIGPAIKAIAEKYKGADATTVEKLAKKIREGGSGVWGAVPMVPNPQLSAADSVTLAKWFLAGGPQTQ